MANWAEPTQDFESGLTLRHVQPLEWNSTRVPYGYMNGIALTMLIGQLPTVLGFSVSGDNFLQRGIASLDGAWQGQINWTAATISLACLAVILGCRCR